VVCLIALLIASGVVVASVVVGFFIGHGKSFLTRAMHATCTVKNFMPVHLFSTDVRKKKIAPL